MSRETVQLRAEPGENVTATVARALTLALNTGLTVEMIHNDRTVRVYRDSTTDDVLAAWERQGDEQQKRHAVGGVWVAYYHDWSAAAVFADELDCLRYALPRTMAVGRWEFGTDTKQIQS